jgi:2-phosphosulfolactate phosphatase
LSSPRSNPRRGAPAGISGSADVTIVVDVLSFSTCVDVAASRGAIILPYQSGDAAGEAFARVHHAELAGLRGVARYSLSPGSFLDAPSGLRCVLPSPNGAALTCRAAAGATVVLAGCLRNAAAVARRAAQLGRTFNVCLAGERWPDGSLRPAVEDWLGAGAILRDLPGPKSPEARSAIAAFTDAAPVVADLIAHSSSGRELIERGFAYDVELAAALDVSRCVPRYDGVALLDDDASRDVDQPPQTAARSPAGTQTGEVS